MTDKLRSATSVPVLLQFRRQGKEMVDFICDYYANQLEAAPVRSQVEVCGVGFYIICWI